MTGQELPEAIHVGHLQIDLVLLVDNGSATAAAPFTVARELGYSGTDMIMRRYGHLLGTRVRSEVVRVPGG